MVKSRITIGLSNPKSPSNVGSVMRAAGCFGVESVFYTGVRYARAAKFQTDTQAVSRRIPLKPVQQIEQGVPNGARLVCVELAEGATALPAFKHPENACYVFGPEDGTLDQALIDRADDVVYIPTSGCLNLAASVNIVLYDRLAKSATPPGDDALIRRSRDTNNRLKVPEAV